MIDQGHQPATSRYLRLVSIYVLTDQHSAMQVSSNKIEFQWDSACHQNQFRFDVLLKTRLASTSAGAQVPMPAIGSQSLSVFVVYSVLYCNDMCAPQLTMVGAKIVDPSRSGELWRPDTLTPYALWNSWTAFTRNHYNSLIQRPIGLSKHQN